MNKKKAGLVSAGVLTALVAASPLAWAVGPSQQAPENCSFSANGEGTPSTPELPGIPQNPVLNVVPQIPVEGNNIGHFGECSTYNNDNGQGNGIGNTFNGQEIPGLPGQEPPIVNPELPPGPVDGGVANS